jgi:hypothetical protein
MTNTGTCARTSFRRARRAITALIAGLCLSLLLVNTAEADTPPAPVPVPTPSGSGPGPYLNSDQIAAVQQAMLIARNASSSIHCVTSYAIILKTGRLSSPVPPDCAALLQYVSEHLIGSPYGPPPPGLTPYPVPTPPRR